MRSAVASPLRACARSRNSSSIDGGNFGAPPNPPVARRSRRPARRRRRRACSADSGAGRPGPCRAEMPATIDVPACSSSPRRVAHASLTAASTCGRPACRAGAGREVGAAVERLARRGREHRHRPAAVPGHRLGGGHVDAVDVGPLLPVDLHADEVLVHLRRGRLVLERLVGHHVAPVAGGVADRHQHRDVAPPRLGEGVGPPLLPVDRVVGVLEQVRAGGAGEAVRHGPSLPHSLLRWSPEGRRDAASRSAPT